jgi:hypothetical protein
MSDKSSLPNTQKSPQPIAYEAPGLVIIGPVRDFTFGSQNKNGDGAGGGKTLP